MSQMKRMGSKLKKKIAEKGLESKKDVNHDA
jgi:hypothetical protein